MNNVIQDKSDAFALRIVGLYKHLVDKSEYVLSKQILRSGTSIGANVVESIYSISKREFIAKMQISLKECAETEYWLNLLYKGKFLDKKIYDSLTMDCKELLRMLTAIIKTSKNNEVKKKI